MTTSARPSRPVRPYSERPHEPVARRTAGPAAAPGRPVGPGAAETFKVPAATPGERLRAARLRRRITLAEAEQATRIRARYLQALEDDDYAALPPAVYSRGFLRNYAIFLGVPPDELMFAVPQRRRERRPGVRSVSTPIRVSAPQSIWLLAAVGAGVLVLVALVWLGLSAPGAGVPANAGGQASTLPLPTLPPAAVPPSATPAPSPTAQGVNVELRTTDRSWVRATVDGRIVLEENLAAGQTQRWTGQRSIVLRVGNAAGIDLTVNGQHLGALGRAGQAMDVEYTEPAPHSTAIPTAGAAR